MVTTLTNASDRLKTILENVRALGPTLRKRAVEAERAGRLSHETMNLRIDRDHDKRAHPAGLARRASHHLTRRAQSRGPFRKLRTADGWNATA